MIKKQIFCAVNHYTDWNRSKITDCFEFMNKFIEENKLDRKNIINVHEGNDNDLTYVELYYWV